MKSMLAAATISLGLAGAALPAAAATYLPAIDMAPAGMPAPHVVPVWWAGPGTVCHRGNNGRRWCRPARPLFWVPGHYDWRGFWVPGHWN